jgi:plastocyanin
VPRTIRILVLLAAGAVAVAGCAGEDAGAGATASGSVAAAPTTSAAPGGGRGGYGDQVEPTSSRGSGPDADADDLRIVGFAFKPKTISAKVGQRLKWEHHDPGVVHTVTADNRAFRSGELEEGDEFSHLFQAAGTFHYHCAIHTDMRGTVKVGA